MLHADAGSEIVDQTAIGWATLDVLNQVVVAAAAELAEAAVRLTPPERMPDLVRRRIAAGYHWVVAGEASRGRAQMAAALEVVPPGPGHAEISWRLGMLTHLDGDLGEAVRLLEAARAAGDLHGELETLTLFGACAMLTNAVSPAQLTDRIEELIGLCGPFPPHENPTIALAIIDFMVGDAASAVARIEPIQQWAIAQGDEIAERVIAGYLAQAYLGTGDWARARLMAQRATAAARDSAMVRAFGLDLYATALIEAHQGNVDLARTNALALIDLAQRRGMRNLFMQGHTVLGFLALSCGDAPTAHAEFDGVLTEARQQGIREWGLIHLVYSELDALVELGELDQAEALAAEIWSHGEEYDRPMELAVAARGRGLVFAARGDLAAAQVELDRSLAEQDRLGWPFERARTLLALGAVLRRGKQKRLARETLRQALSIFDELGARLWSARASAELNRIGGRPVGTGSLTATELQVARLAADGHTNREVADRLFLSPKTVAAHLTSVYAKLGVRSRTELSRHFRELTDRP